MAEHLRAILYARISKNDPNAPKVERQLADCRALAGREGYSVVAEYADDGISASTFKHRPGWASLLQDLADGTGNIAVAVDEDRFTRQTAEKITLLATCEAAGAILHTVHGGAVDPADPEGELFSLMRGGFARAEMKRKGRKQADANAHRAKEGRVWRYGPRPFGYNDDRVTARSDEAELIRWATAFIIGGGPMYRAVKKFRESGLSPTFNLQGRGWGNASVRSVLTRGRNARIVEYRRTEIPDVEGKWEGIVSREDLMTVRRVLASKEPGTRVGEAKTLSGGIARCNCGGKLNSSYSTSRGKVIPSYRCELAMNGRANETTAAHSSILAHVLDPIVREKLLEVYFTRPAGNAAERAQTDAFGVLYERREKARRGIDSLRAAVREGIFTPGEIARDVAELRAEIQSIEAQLTRAAASSAHAAMLEDSMAAIWVKVADAVDQEDRLAAPGAMLIHSMERLGVSREEAINTAVTMFWDRNKDQPAVRADLGRRFDALDLDQRRNLVRSLLQITVRPGRGTDRIEIDSAGTS